MTRAELLNSAEYWQEMAENECWREGIECKIHLIDSNKLQHALIDKDALVAEIERLEDVIKATAIDNRISKEQAEAYKVCTKLRAFIEEN